MVLTAISHTYFHSQNMYQYMLDTLHIELLHNYSMCSWDVWDTPFLVEGSWVTLKSLKWVGNPIIKVNANFPLSR
jgi:hypothetical protein